MAPHPLDVVVAIEAHDDVVATRACELIGTRRAHDRRELILTEVG